MSKKKRSRVRPNTRPDVTPPKPERKVPEINSPLTTAELRIAARTAVLYGKPATAREFAEMADEAERRELGLPLGDDEDDGPPDDGDGLPAAPPKGVAL